MKKILMFVAFLFCLSGCNFSTPEEQIESRRKYVQNNSSLIDITFNDETHEYIRFID